MLDDLDPLRFAAGQGVGLAIEAQVVESDVDHRLEALEEDRDDRLGHGIGHQPQDGDELADLHRRELGDDCPSIREPSAAWLIRAPLQTGQVRIRRYGSIRFCVRSDTVSRRTYERSIFSMTPR